MNTPDQLRETLTVRAREAGTREAGAREAGPGDRAAEVRGRIRRARRLRAAGSVAAVAVTVGAIGMIGTLTAGPAGDRSPAPADAQRTLAGEAPETIAGSGWTFRFDTVQESSGGMEVSHVLPPADRPRLVTWGTAGAEQEVTVLVGEGEHRWLSDQGDFEDFLVLPEEFEGPVRVSGSAPGVALAVYEIDRSGEPDGVSEHGIHYRERVGPRTLQGAAIGEIGQLEVEVDYTVPEGPVSLNLTCSGLPEDALVTISAVGSEQPWSTGPCGGARFDAGGERGHTNMLGVPGLEPGARATARIWVSRDFEDPTPVEPTAYPDARLSLGVYGEDQPVVALDGRRRPVAAEWWGHRFELERVADFEGPENTEALPGTGPWLAEPVGRSTGRYAVDAEVDGLPVARVTGGVGPEGLHYLPADLSSYTSVVDPAGPDSRAGMLIYRLVE